MRIAMQHIYPLLLIWIMITINFWYNNTLLAYDKPSGFLWYNEVLVNDLEESKQSTANNIQEQLEAHDQRIEALKHQFTRAQRIALDNPTLENIVIAQMLQKQIIEKSQRFAAMWQLATLLDYRLVNLSQPSNSLHKRLYEEKQNKENNLKLKQIAKNWGLILQVNNECSYCHVFAPIVQKFANKFAFQLLYVSNHPGQFMQFATVQDTAGLLQKFNPENITPVLYLVASNQQVIYPIAYGLISDEQIINNILAIDKHYPLLEVKGQ